MNFDTRLTKSVRNMSETSSICRDFRIATVSAGTEASVQPHREQARLTSELSAEIRVHANADSSDDYAEKNHVQFMSGVFKLLSDTHEQAWRQNQAEIRTRIFSKICARIVDCQRERHWLLLLSLT